MNVYYALRRESLNGAPNTEPFILLGQNERNLLLVTKTADNPVDLAKRYHLYLRGLRTRQIAQLNSHFVTFTPPLGVRIFSVNKLREEGTEHFTLERLTEREIAEFESTLMTLSR